VRGGDPLARAGEVLALVSECSSAAPVQDQQWQGRVSPFELALAMPGGRPKIRVPDSDVLQRVWLALFCLDRRRQNFGGPSMSASPLPGPPESMRTGKEHVYGEGTAASNIRSANLT
jgi:hypothetical protein